MAEVKMTKKNVIEAMLNEETIKANEVYKKYLEHELELLNKKSNKSKKDTEENQKYMKTVYALVQGATAEDGITITEILGEGIKNGVLETTMSNQKVRTLLGYLIDDKKVERRQKGRKITFVAI